MYCDQLYSQPVVRFSYVQNKSLDEKEKIRNNISSNWNKDMFIYPYSGAKYMKLFHNHSLYRSVFKKSLNSTKSAFDIINTFYKLDNDEEI